MGYDAFISYSHAADGALAPALQSALHRFAKPWWKLRAVNLFRDETSLAAAHDLTQSIRDALEGARFFILLASPGAAASIWVEREVKLWIATKPIENILIVLTDGAIAWSETGDFDWARTSALPHALAGVFKGEPLWVDLSFARHSEQLSTRDPRFQQAAARLAARLHGKSLDEIAGEEVRQHRRTRRVARAAVGGAGSGAVQGRRATTLTEVAATYGVLGSYEEASRRIGEAITILTAETARRRDDVAMHAALAKSYKVQGDLLWWQRKELAAAIAAGSRSADTYATLAKAHPKHGDADEWRVSQYRSLIGVGDIYFDRANAPGEACAAREPCLAQAHRTFTAALDVARGAPAQEDRDFRWKNAVLVSRERLAKVDEARGDFSGAAKTYSELLEEYERISAAQPDNSKWRENLIAVHWRVGKRAEANCALANALAHYDQALALARKLHQAEPERVDWARELASSLKLSAQVQAALGAREKAQGHYQEGLNLYGGLIAVQPANQDLANDAGEIRRALDGLGAKEPGCVAVTP